MASAVAKQPRPVLSMKTPKFQQRINSLYCEQEWNVNHTKYNEKLNKIILKIKLNQSEYSSGSDLSRVLVWTRV